MIVEQIQHIEALKRSSGKPTFLYRQEFIQVKMMERRWNDAFT
jgi:hypothetical protein